MTMLSTSSVFQSYGTSIKHWDPSYTFRNIISYTIYCILSQWMHIFLYRRYCLQSLFPKTTIETIEILGKSCYSACQGPPEILLLDIIWQITAVLTVTC